MTEMDQVGVITDRVLLEQISWLLPSKEGYIIRTPGKKIESGTQCMNVSCSILTNYSEDHTMLWRTECSVPFVPLRLCSIEGGYYAYGSMVGFGDEGQVYRGALMKLSNQGDVLWTDMPQNGCEQYSDCAVLASGDIVAIGNGTKNGIMNIPTATCYTTDGAIAWEHQYADYNIDRFDAIIDLDEKGFLTVGSSNDDFFKKTFLVHDSDGNVVRQWISELNDQTLLPVEVNLHKTKIGYFAVISADVLPIDRLIGPQRKTVIQRISIDQN